MASPALVALPLRRAPLAGISSGRPRDGRCGRKRSARRRCDSTLGPGVPRPPRVAERVSLCALPVTRRGRVLPRSPDVPLAPRPFPRIPPTRHPCLSLAAANRTPVRPPAFFAANAAAHPPAFFAANAAVHLPRILRHLRSPSPCFAACARAHSLAAPRRCHFPGAASSVAETLPVPRPQGLASRRPARAPPVRLLYWATTPRSDEVRTRKRRDSGRGGGGARTRGRCAESGRAEQSEERAAWFALHQTQAQRAGRSNAGRS